jgi:hypothetical protein
VTAGMAVVREWVMVRRGRGVMFVEFVGESVDGLASSSSSGVWPGSTLNASPVILHVTSCSATGSAKVTPARRSKSKHKQGLRQPTLTPPCAASDPNGRRACTALFSCQCKPQSRGIVVYLRQKKIQTVAASALYYHHHRPYK